MSGMPIYLFIYICTYIWQLGAHIYLVQLFLTLKLLLVHFSSPLDYFSGKQTHPT